jgi:nucleoside 2-deoxyribosyltransferase
MNQKGQQMQSDFLVYLAGPITGLTYDEGQDWRTFAKADLAKSHIKAVSPLRAKDFLRSLGVLSGTAEEYGHLHCLSSPRGIMTRDRFDATRCDVLFANLLGAKAVSIGTVMEIAWADVNRVPVVVAMEESGNPHEHAMINEAIGFRVPTLAEALHVIKAIADNEVVR